MTNKLKMPDIEFDLSNQHVIDTMQKVTFLDIETSLLDARVFRTGKQQINANQLRNTTKILTVAGGSMLDLYTKGEKGIWGVGNHQFKKRFKADPLDDTETLERVWHILDQSDVIVAHNARFDRSWLLGRFLELGWKLPSRFSTICTYRNLHQFNMTSKKLDELSRNLINTKKISTDFSLWDRCSNGEKAAFDEMLKYNKGDIGQTLFKVYLRTCQYNPQLSVDMTDHSLELPQCRVTGDLLEDYGTHVNHTTGLEYYLYQNTKNGLIYRDRYTTDSKKADIGKVRFYI